MISSFTVDTKRVALTAIAVLFFMMGVLTSLNDVLIPHLKNVFQLSYFEALLIQVVWFFAYLINSYPCGQVVRRTSYRVGMISGYLVSALGCLLFFGAWYLDSYYFFLVALFVVASGVSFLQVVSSPYGAALGSPSTEHQRLVFLHAFFALGTTVAPIVAGPEILNASRATGLMGLSLLSLTQQGAMTLLLPYGFLGGTLMLLALVNSVLPMPDLLAQDRQDKESCEDSAWNYPHTILGAVAIFFYVGTEVLLGSFIINYALLEQVDLPYSVLSLFVSLYWGGMLIGRLLGPWLMNYARADYLLIISGIGACGLLIGGMISSGLIAVLLVALVGLFNSIMFPVIYGLSMKGLSPIVATQASAIVTTSIVGGAIIPLVGGVAADHWGIKAAFCLSVFCYLIISAYGFFSWRKQVLGEGS
ncbi:sugar MFS transporter [Endozoicomonas elysicola]|uniref:sugar MFS transporter n=1 Tax=Endozoicomonas elysicola TaxID=305900 RepID=UPI00037FE4EE|nr:sugar MFS transporter [Endozoicomonas elysicola]